MHSDEHQHLTSMSMKAQSEVSLMNEEHSSAPALDFGFDNSYARLPERFYSRQSPTPVASPQLIQVNAELARFLGLDAAALTSLEAVEVFAGNRIAAGSEPLAMAYAGHQFGHFVPQLGDGRANLLGEVVARDGRRYDVQLKGSGPTAFSRRGDGRAALGPVLREYLVSEAMHALGVPTTRALAAVTTGERVLRDSVMPGAILTRIAASHIRVGTFQYFAARQDTEGLRTLTAHALARHYPQADAAMQPARALLTGVISRQAKLVAQWMLLGFIHGVMNTDNMSISGETIDYGPCAFIEAYDPATVFSSIDAGGRYAYASQPNAALWNLARLAECLLPLLLEETGSEEAALASAHEALGTFEPTFQSAKMTGFRRKLGLVTEKEGDAALIDDLLTRMTANAADFTLTFRRLSDAALDPGHDETVRTFFADPAAYDAWAGTWRNRLAVEPATASERAASMKAVSPSVIPRNHLVEELIQAAVTRRDFAPFHAMLNAVTRPFENRPREDKYTQPAPPEQRVFQTFCGT